MQLFLTLIGLLLIVEGLPYVASPETMQRWLRQIQDMPPDHLRIIGLAAMLSGLLLCFIAQKSGFFS